MSIFSSVEQARQVFESLFKILLEDEDFVAKMKESDLSLRLIQTHPDIDLFVSVDGVLDGSQAPKPAAIRMKMSCDTADSLWRGDLLMPLALGTGRLRIKGSVSKALEFVPMLRPAFDKYPDIAAANGVAR